MKKNYIQPKINDGLATDLSHFLLSSLRGDGVSMEITSEGADHAAEGRGSFWDDKE